MTISLNKLVVVYDYKEPLAKVQSGFGYYGCLSGTSDKEKIQCHVCGKLFKDLNFHLKVHDIPVKDYKQKYGLASSTKLISPVMKQQRREKFMETFTFEKREKYRAMACKAWVASEKKGGANRKLSLETKNKRGSCPDQIIAKIIETTKKLGHVPSLQEFMREPFGDRYWHLIRRTYKTWNNALKVANLRRCLSPSQFITHKYHPSELIELLSIFTQEEHRIPRYSDFGNGMLPAYTTYARKFGTLEKARSLAGVYDLVS